VRSATPAPHPTTAPRPRHTRPHGLACHAGYSHSLAKLPCISCTQGSPNLRRPLPVQLGAQHSRQPAQTVAALLPRSCCPWGCLPTCNPLACGHGLPRTWNSHFLRSSMHSTSMAHASSSSSVMAASCKHRGASVLSELTWAGGFLTGQTQHTHSAVMRGLCGLLMCANPRQLHAPLHQRQVTHPHRRRWMDTGRCVCACTP